MSTWKKEYMSWHRPAWSRMLDLTIKIADRYKAQGRPQEHINRVLRMLVS